MQILPKYMTFSGVPAAGFTGNALACINTAQTFTDTSKITSGTISNWNWNFGDASATAVVNATTNAAQTHTYTAAGTYTVTLTVISTTGCTSTVFSQPITIAALPTVSFSALTGVCNTAAAFALTGGLPAIVTGVGTGVYSGPGVSGGNFNPSVAGVGTHTITYTYTSVAGCIVPATQTIAVSQSAVLSIAAVDVLCKEHEPVVLVPNITGGVFAGPGITGSTFTPLVAGVGTFNITYSIPSNVCSVPATLPIVVSSDPCKLCIDPPTVFTPNNDGFYDKWVVINGTCAKVVKVNVYNRWGGQVYENANYDNSWDGTYKGKALPDGTYYFIVVATLRSGGQAVLKGNVTIMR